jgi:hypothetical protein
MTLDDHDSAETQDQLDSTPAYPPTTSTDAGSPAAEEETSEQIERDAQISDREIPRRPVADSPADAAPVDEAALFERGELDKLNGRWSDIQASFVDEPRRAVEQADALVSDVITEIGDSFAKQRTRLEAQWDRGGEVSTEDLRQTLQRYRSFFSRLLDL